MPPICFDVESTAMATDDDRPTESLSDRLRQRAQGLTIPSDRDTLLSAASAIDSAAARMTAAAEALERAHAMGRRLLSAYD